MNLIRRSWLSIAGIICGMLIAYAFIQVMQPPKTIRMNTVKGPRIVVSDGITCFWYGKEVSVRELQKNVNANVDGKIGLETVYQVQLWYVVEKAIGDLE